MAFSLTSLIRTSFQKVMQIGVPKAPIYQLTTCNSVSPLLSAVQLAVFSRGVCSKGVRDGFGRPSEVIRIRRFAWHARMATRGGRAILRRRILKGRHVLCHPY